MTDKISNLAETVGDSKMWSAKQCLEAAIRDIESQDVDILMVAWTDQKTGKLHRLWKGANNAESVFFLSHAWLQNLEETRG